jgi:hypothetical protein
LELTEGLTVCSGFAAGMSIAAAGTARTSREPDSRESCAIDVTPMDSRTIKSRYFFMVYDLMYNKVTP